MYFVFYSKHLVVHYNTVYKVHPVSNSVTLLKYAANNFSRRLLFKRSLGCVSPLVIINQSGLVRGRMTRSPAKVAVVVLFHFWR